MEKTDDTKDSSANADSGFARAIAAGIRARKQRRGEKASEGFEVDARFEDGRQARGGQLPLESARGTKVAISTLDLLDSESAVRVSVLSSLAKGSVKVDAMSLIGAAIAADSAELMADAHKAFPLDFSDARLAGIACALGAPEALSWLLKSGSATIDAQGVPALYWATPDALDSIGSYADRNNFARCARILALHPSMAAFPDEAKGIAMERIGSAFEMAIMSAKMSKGNKGKASASERPAAVFALMEDWLVAFDAAWGVSNGPTRALAPTGCSRLCEIAMDPWYLALVAEPEPKGDLAALGRWVASAAGKDWARVEADAQDSGWSLSQGAMTWTQRELGLEGLSWVNISPSLKAGWDKLSAMLGSSAWGCKGLLAKDGDPESTWSLRSERGPGSAMRGLMSLECATIHPAEIARALRSWANKARKLSLTADQSGAKSFFREMESFSGEMCELFHVCSDADLAGQLNVLANEFGMADPADGQGSGFLLAWADKLDIVSLSAERPASVAKGDKPKQRL